MTRLLTEPALSPSQRDEAEIGFFCHAPVLERVEAAPFHTSRRGDMNGLPGAEIVAAARPRAEDPDMVIAGICEMALKRLVGPGGIPHEHSKATGDDGIKAFADGRVEARDSP